MCAKLHRLAGDRRADLPVRDFSRRGIGQKVSNVQGADNVYMAGIWGTLFNSINVWIEARSVSLGWVNTPKDHSLMKAPVTFCPHSLVTNEVVCCVLCPIQGALSILVLPADRRWRDSEVHISGWKKGCSSSSRSSQSLTEHYSSLFIFPSPHLLHQHILFCRCRYNPHLFQK